MTEQKRIRVYKRVQIVEECVRKYKIVCAKERWSGLCPKTILLLNNNKLAFTKLKITKKKLFFFKLNLQRPIDAI